MKNLVVHQETYQRIKIKDSKTLIKYSPVSKKGWDILKAKNIKFLNIPTKVEPLSQEEKRIYKYQQTKIELPYLKDYETLGHSKELENLTTKELLIFTKELTKRIKQMHKQNIYHTDIHSENIMTKNKDIQIIDLDAVLVEDYISNENIYEEEDMSFKEKQLFSQTEDKLSIIRLLLYYLQKGTFKDQMHDYIDLDTLNLPKNIKKEISAHQLSQIIPNKDYYYEDIIEELLKIGYESPKLITKKWIKQNKKFHYTTGGTIWKN